MFDGLGSSSSSSSSSGGGAADDAMAQATARAKEGASKAFGFLKSGAATAAAKAKEAAAELKRQAGGGADDADGPGGGASALQSMSFAPVRTDSGDAESAEAGLVSGAMSEGQGVVDEFKGIFPKLTFRQRMIACLTCMAIGFVLDFMGTLALLGGKRHIPEYAAFYTCGNLISIAASAFFVGPRRQLKLMCEPVRRVACAIFIGTMILTLVMALTYPVPLLLIAMLVVQYCALIWYGASFIYGGRTCLKAAIKKASVWCVKLMNS